MEQLQQTFDLLLQSVSTSFKRYMYERINLKSRMWGLVGPRGVGKTTLLLQYAKLEFNRAETLYVNAEDIYFANHTLLKLAEEWVKKGGRYLLIDEIHKYQGWAKELKLIYDYCADLHVGFTGSSILDIQQGAADLSRRAVMHHMQGLSFREYLSLYHDINLPSYSLDEIVKGQVELPQGFHPYQYFDDFLKHGYYPFSQEEDFVIRLRQVVISTIEIDVAQYAGLSVSLMRKLKRLLMIIADSVPFKPNMSSIAQMLEVSRNNLADYFLYLERSGLICQLRTETGGIRSLGKVDKVYLDNTNLMEVLSAQSPDVGNLRETFFFNQLRVNNDVITSSKADFTIGHYTFEVGGPNKQQKQIAGLEHAYIVKDGIETGYGNVIPLWLMGLNY